MKVEVTSVCVRGNIEKVGLSWITRSLTSVPADKLPPNGLPIVLALQLQGFSPGLTIH